MKKTLLILLITPLFSFGQVNAKIQNQNNIDSSNVYKTFYAGNDFQITLPNNWIEIPKLILDSHVNSLNKFSDQNKSVDYAYQMIPYDQYFQNPYIAIMIKRVGKVPESEFINMKKLDSDDIKDFEAIYKGLGSDLAQSEVIYDQTNKTQWFSITSYIKGVGNVKSFNAMKLTEYGYIQFSGTASEKESLKYAKIYLKIVQSITLDEKDIYKSSLTDNEKKIFGLEPKEFGSGLAFVVLIGMYFMYKRFYK